ncbi:SCO2583 family membrane protein [Streptomyces sp. NPDC002577]
MGGPGDPPEGVPEGAPGGGEDEYRSVVFDESFIRAARLQESSARERMTDHAPAVRRRPALRRGLSRQALILVLLIALAFGTAIYMGVRHPYQAPATAQPPEPLRMTVIPLAPHDPVPGAADTKALFAHSKAAEFRVGAEGITLPASRRTAHFSDSQVVTALTTAKDYLVESSLDPEVLTGGSVRSVRVLLDPQQLDQFDQSFDHPAADGRHAATGWLVRFDPAKAELADPQIRVQGTLNAVETDSGTLEVTSNHTFVYALRPAGADGDAKASLFTVRRELQFRFDRDDLRMHQAELVVSYVQAGPLSCSVDSAGRLQPLLAGQTAKAGGPAAGTDPFATDSAASLCGTLAPGAQPSL